MTSGTFVTVCRLLSVNGMVLKVRGLDAIDGTPVLDIKPVMPGFLPRGAIREPDWAKELMAGYWPSRPGMRNLGIYWKATAGPQN